MRLPKIRSIGLCAAGVAVAAVTAVVWFALSHRDSQSVSAPAAKAEFDRLRARFAAERPLLDMKLRETSTNVSTARAAAPLHSFHTVIFDTRGGDRLVHVTVPYWLGRRYARHDSKYIWLGELTFLDDTEFDPEPIQLSLEQIERHGPGLLVDYQHPGGGQFIAWVE